MTSRLPRPATAYLRGLPQGNADLQSLGLTPDTLQDIYNGQRSAGQRREALSEYWQRDVSADDAEALTLRLAAAGYLTAGDLEPHPVPPSSWMARPALSPALATAHLPSSVPGSLAQPAYVGGIQRYFVGAGRRRGANLPSAPFVLLGRLVVWPIYGRVAGLALLSWWALMLAALWGRRDHFIDALALQIDSAAYGLSVPLIIVVIHLVSQSSTAALVRRLTHAHAEVSLPPRWLPFPHLRVNTAGRAEQLPRRERLRLVAAPLVGSFSLLTLMMTVWVMSGMQNESLVVALTLPMLVVAGSIVIRANPLVRYDGHAFLSQWLGISDLRLQSMYALFRIRRPWQHHQRTWSFRALRLWFAATTSFAVFVLVMLAHFALPMLLTFLGGIGFLLVVIGLGVMMYKQLGRPPMPRSGLGWESWWTQLRQWRPTRKRALIFGGIVLLCIIPYRYEPSGDFEVLPTGRADVRALVAGDVREVLAEEGDMLEAGQAVVRLADAEGRARVAASKATLAQLHADQALLEKGARPEEIEVAKGRVNTLERRVQFSRATEQRLARAFRQGGIATEDYERARGTAEVDEQLLEEARRALELISSPTREELLQATEAKIEREQALLALHEEQLEQTVLRAPIAGRLVSDSLQFSVGRYLERGEVIGLIENTESRLAEVMISESAIGTLHEGARARLRAWAYPNSGFEGVVTRIAPVADTERYGRFVRVQVAVDDPDLRLKSGMTGAGKLAGPRYPAIWVFTRALWRFFMVEIWSWLP